MRKSTIACIAVVIVLAIIMGTLALADFISPYVEIHRAELLECNNKHAQAIAILNRLIDHKLYLPEAYCWRGIAFHACGRNQDAVTDTTQSLQLEPNKLLPLLMRATIFYEMGNYNDSLRDSSRILDLTDPESKHSINELCSYDDLMADLTPENIKKGMLMDSRSGAYNIRAGTNVQLKHYEAAISDANMAINLNAKTGGRTYYYRAQAYKELGKKLLAESDYRKAKDLGYNPGKSNQPDKIHSTNLK